jgi:hypothetical protein
MEGNVETYADGLLKSMGERTPGEAPTLNPLTD